MTTATCPTCGGPLTEGGTAFLCAPGGGRQLATPSYCPSKECRKARDDAAIARAIESGLIDP